MKPYSILVVEDDEIDRMNIEKAFKTNHILNPVHFAVDGIDAQEKLQDGSLTTPLLILLDLRMPRMDGMAFLEHLRKDERWKLTPVIILTTSHEEKDRMMAYQLGIVGYVIKPIDIGEFVRAVSLMGQYWSLCEFPKE